MTKLLKILSGCLCVAVCFVTVPLSMVQAQVTLTVEDSSGFVGSTNNSISVELNNPSEKVSAVTVDICDVDDYLSCSTCEPTTRSAGFPCLATEGEDGCMRVVLVDFTEDNLIEEGNGPIFTIICDVSPSAPSGDFRELNPENENIANDLQIPLDVSSASGDFSFESCGSDGDCDDGLYCSGVESCDDDVCQPGTDPCPAGVECNEGTNSCGGSSTTTTGPPSSDPIVTVTCGEPTPLLQDNIELCEPEACTTCTAVTTLDGDEVDGTYTWALNGEAYTANEGNSVEVCGDSLEDGNNELVATDTQNDDVTGSETLLCGGVASVCSIDVLTDSLPKSNLVALYPIAFRIETIGIEPLNAFTPVTIDCDADGDGPLSKSVLKTGKVIIPSFGTATTVIVQTALIWPAWWTQSLDRDSETCTVTVGTCPATDTFELTYGLFGIPLSE